jgi:2-polyprenyl-6-methoxyphenol hydroxylase-like FAD-dependent oxidoreductase
VSVRVFEAVPKVTPAGVGITLLPHATRVLAELGVVRLVKQRPTHRRTPARCGLQPGQQVR